MSIFRRDEPVSGGSVPASPPTPAAARNQRSSAERRSGAGGTTHVADGTKLTGQVHGTTDLFVEGEVEGKIQIESDVSVGAGGRVKGDIEARNVRIGGHVVGNVRGRDRVEILASGRLEGDVLAPRVVLAEGAFFKGKVEMTGAREGDKGKTAEGAR